MIGSCSGWPLGLGRALAIDPLLIRIAFVVLGLFSGVGVLVYIAASCCSPIRRRLRHHPRSVASPGSSLRSPR